MNVQKFKIDWSSTLSKIKEQNSRNNNFKDERIYSPQYNDNGTAQAIIRFLPSPDTDLPFVSLYSHSIKGPGGWFIENCPTTLKQECPVCKANSAIWDSNPDLARSRKRKQNFYSNILIIKDPLNPENEGKIFIYKYGKKVYDKIMEKIQPGNDSIENPIMVFDYYEGADFKLIIKKIKVSGVEMPNYDSCQFDNVSCVGTDEKIEKIQNSLFPLSPFCADTNFKSYDELENKFDRVVGTSSRGKTETDSHSNFSQPNSTAVKNMTNSAPVSKIVEPAIFDGPEDKFFDELQKDD